jgi:hypothetical protein
MKLKKNKKLKRLLKVRHNRYYLNFSNIFIQKLKQRRRKKRKINVRTKLTRRQHFKNTVKILKKKMKYLQIKIQLVR